MKNEYKMTKKEMMSWAKEYHLPGAANIILFILWCVVLAMGLFLIVLLSLVGGELLNWSVAICITVLSAFRLFFSRLIFYSNRYKVLSKTYGVSEWTRTTEFLDDEIVLTDHTSVMRFQYRNIKKIKEKNNVVIIFMNDNMGMRLYKDAFVEGSWEECKEKIQSMTK